MLFRSLFSLVATLNGTSLGPSNVRYSLSPDLLISSGKLTSHFLSILGRKKTNRVEFVMLQFRSFSNLVRAVSNFARNQDFGFDFWFGVDDDDFGSNFIKGRGFDFNFVN